jgi:hypothetical protein
LDEKLIVGDGTPANVFSSESRARPYIQLFERRTVAGDGERYVGPKISAYHLGKAEQFRLFRARSTTSTHTAAHLRSDALYVATHASCAAVLYTSDLTAYSNMYLVEVGEFDELPDLE